MPKRPVARGVSPCGSTWIRRRVAGCRGVSGLSESQRKMPACERCGTGGFKLQGPSTCGLRT